MYDIIINGSGIVGLALAVALSPGSLNIAIVDKQNPAFSKDPRVSAITPANVEFLSNLHTWSRLDQHKLGRFYKMDVWDALSKAHVHFNSREMGHAHMGFIAENALIQHAFFSLLADALNVTTFFNVTPHELRTDTTGVTLILDDGRCLQAGLIIGADGSQSWVRQSAGFETEEKNYHQKALVATIKTEQAHAHTARQVFLNSGPLAFLPLADPHYCSIVWSNIPEEADKLQAMPEAEFEAALNKAFSNTLGQLNVVGSRLTFPLLNRQAKTYVKPHIALIGDAAHLIHPLAGQGLNLGLYDAKCLAEKLLQAHQKGREIGALDTLRKYERERKPHNQLVAQTMTGFKELFSISSPLVSSTRSIGMDIASHAKWINHRLMRFAMGI